MLFALEGNVKGQQEERREDGTYTTENASKTRTNFPPPFHGERTCESRPPVSPAAMTSVKAGSLMVMSVAPRISTKQIGTIRPKKVRKKTLRGGVSAGNLQL